MTNTSDWTCKYCDTKGSIRLEWRTKLVAKPLGRWSLSGMQDKTVASEVSWPWAICNNCGHESEGEK